MVSSRVAGFDVATVGAAPPTPGGVRTIDELSERLRLLQAWSGFSLREIHRRVLRSRQDRGIAELPAYNTIYRCMLPGRSRLDVELVVDIVRVLLDEARAAEWRQAHQAVSGLAADAAVVSVSDTLPDDLAAFTGRSAELTEALDATVDRRTGVGTGLVLVEGMPGVGKTAFAVHLAHRLSAFGVGAEICLTVNLRGFDPGRPPADPAAVLEGFLRLLGRSGSQLHPLDLAARAEAFREALAGRRALLLLDNAATEDQIRPLLPHCPHCVTVVTSRRRLNLPSARRIWLDVFAPLDSVDLLRRAVGQPVIDQDRRTAERIAELAGHLPLALALLASRITAAPDWTLADQLDRLIEHRDWLRLDDAVALALSSSYQALPADCQRMLRLVGIHPGRDFDTAAAAALAGTPTSDATRLLTELVRANLVQERAGRYELHDLVRMLAADRVRDHEPPAVRRATLDRLFEHYRTAVASVVNRFAPHDQDRWHDVVGVELPAASAADRAAARRWLDTELPNLVATALSAADRGRSRYATDLSLMLQYYLDVSGFFREAETLHRAAVRSTTGQHRDDEAARGRSYNSLGCVHWRLGRYVDARDCFQQALDLARSAGNRNGVASGLANVALGHFRLGHYQDAIDHQRQALVIFEAEGRSTRICTTLAGLGWGELRLGRTEVALGHFQRALGVVRGLEHGAVEEAYALASVAAGFEAVGCATQARAHYEQALELSRRLEFPTGQSDALNGLGRLDLAADRTARAIQRHRQALALSEQIGNRPFTIEVRNDLGTALRRAGQPGEALDQHQAALSDAQALEERFELGRAHAGIAAVNLDRAASRLALASLHEALALFTALHVPEATTIRSTIESL